MVPRYMNWNRRTEVSGRIAALTLSEGGSF